jgi:hypothetical protein
MLYVKPVWEMKAHLFVLTWNTHNFLLTKFGKLQEMCHIDQCAEKKRTCVWERMYQRKMPGYWWWWSSRLLELGMRGTTFNVTLCMFYLFCQSKHIYFYNVIKTNFMKSAQSLIFYSASFCGEAMTESSNTLLWNHPPWQWWVSCPGVLPHAQVCCLNCPFHWGWMDFSFYISFLR